MVNNMRKIRRHKRKKQKKMIIILSLSLLMILTVGYAAFQTNLSITAKGNIKAKDITDDIVTEGDGLYKDPYEEGRYIYRGKNPDNYIWFNEELWRIIAKETDGTYKIIKDEPLSNRAFDSVEARTIGYCSYRLTWGCNAWNSSDNLFNVSYQGIVEKDAELNIYI